MNIDQFRALKQEMQTDSGSEQPNVQAVETSTGTEGQAQTETTQVPDSTEQARDAQPNDQTETNPTKISIEGLGEVDPKEILEWKNGYLRQSDYTKKTQEIANQKREMEDALALYQKVKNTPEIAEQASQQYNIPNLDPSQQRLIELENKLMDMQLEREINLLQSKYDDFEVREVLTVAQEKGLMNLEDAYLLAKSLREPVNAPADTVDTETLREQLRQELLKEIAEEKASTQTMISSNSNNTPVRDDTPTLSPTEARVAQMMKMSAVEYAKWRDKK